MNKRVEEFGKVVRELAAFAYVDEGVGVYSVA